VDAGAIKCKAGSSSATIIRHTFDGFTITGQPVGMLFERGDSYFTFGFQCSY
jgi:hypothetical protein